MKFSLSQLLGFTAACAILFWLLAYVGLPLVMFLLGVVATWTVGQIRHVDSQRGGLFWGALIHFVIAKLLVLSGQLHDPLLVLTLHVIPGAYLGVCGAVYRQAVELSQVDGLRATAPEEPTPPVDPLADSSEHALD